MYKRQQVVYDCPQIVIVNKPAGLAVDGPEDDTLLNRTLLYLNQQGEYKENDLYTCLLYTSHQLLFGKTRRQAQRVQKLCLALGAARPAGKPPLVEVGIGNLPSFRAGRCRCV